MLSLVNPTQAHAEEPTTTTTVVEPAPLERDAWLDDEGVVALGMVVAFGVGTAVGRNIWGAP